MPERLEKMTDTSRNPNNWSEEALDVFWRTYIDILELTASDVFHHPEYYSRIGFWDQKDVDKIDDTLAWNAAWIAADNVDFR